MESFLCEYQIMTYSRDFSDTSSVIVLKCIIIIIHPKNKKYVQKQPSARSMLAYGIITKNITLFSFSIFMVNIWETNM